MTAPISLGRLLASRGPVHVEGRLVDDGWKVTLKDDWGGALPLSRLVGEELARIVTLLDTAAGIPEVRGAEGPSVRGMVPGHAEVVS